MDGGDGRLSLISLSTSDGHIIMVIIGLITMGIVLTLIDMVGITDIKEPRIQGVQGSRVLRSAEALVGIVHHDVLWHTIIFSLSNCEFLRTIAKL